MPLPAVTAAGNLTADPELRCTPGGKSLAKFTVACNDRRKDDAGNWVDGDTSYVDVTAWGPHLSEQCAEALTKGTPVVVTGRLKQRRWEDEKTGAKRSAWEVTADVVAVQVRAGQQAKTSRAQRAEHSDPWGAPTAGSHDEPPF